MPTTAPTRAKAEKQSWGHLWEHIHKLTEFNVLKYNNLWCYFGSPPPRYRFHGKEFPRPDGRGPIEAMMGGILGGNMTYSRKLMRLKSIIYGYNMVVITHPTPLRLKHPCFILYQPHSRMGRPRGQVKSD